LDAEATAIVANESLTITGANSIVRRGLEAAGEKILSAQGTFSQYGSVGGITAGHLSAVLNVGGSGSISSSRVALSQVVVSGPNTGVWSRTETWANWFCLAQLYRSAVNKRSNDRYLLKLEEAERQRDVAWARIFESGIPTLVRPLSRPAALYTLAPGTWGTANLSSVGGSGTVDDNVSVVVTFTSTDVTTNNESHPSEVAVQATTTGNVIKVDITSLNPPDGTQSLAERSQAITAPLQATGWNVYAVIEGGVLTLQNSSPIAIATKTYTFPDNPTTSGAAVAVGQSPERNLAFQNVALRG